MEGGTGCGHAGETLGQHDPARKPSHTGGQVDVELVGPLFQSTPTSCNHFLAPASEVQVREDALLQTAALQKVLDQRIMRGGGDEEAGEEEDEEPPGGNTPIHGGHNLQTQESLLDRKESGAFTHLATNGRGEWPRQRVVSSGGKQILQPWTSDPSHVMAWGCAHNYQLGDGGYTARPMPTHIKNLSRLGSPLLDVSAGADHSMAIDIQGRIYSWGLADLGRLGHNDQTDVQAPKQIKALKHVRIVEAKSGMYNSACLDDHMRLYTWGCGGHGQLGHGEEKDEWAPKLVSGLVGVQVVSVSLGFRHTAAVCAQGRVYTWGFGEQGQLGDGTMTSRTEPAQVDSRLLNPDGPPGQGSKQGCVMIACGGAFTAALREDGRIFTWGSSDFGGLGLGAVRKSGVPRMLSSNILDKRNFVWLSAGEEHCAAVTEKGGLYLWGQGCFGAVGKPPQNRAMHPPDVKRPRRLNLEQGSRAHFVSCGANYSVVLCTDGNVLAVGDNNVHVREVVGGLKVNAVRCGRFHTMLLVAESELHGFNCEGSWGSWMLSGWRWVCSLLLGRNSGAMVVPAYEAVGQEV